MEAVERNMSNAVMRGIAVLPALDPLIAAVSDFCLFDNVPYPM